MNLVSFRLLFYILLLYSFILFDQYSSFVASDAICFAVESANAGLIETRKPLSEKNQSRLGHRNSIPFRE